MSSVRLSFVSVGRIAVRRNSQISGECIIISLYSVVFLLVGVDPGSCRSILRCSLCSNAYAIRCLITKRDVLCCLSCVVYLEPVRYTRDGAC